MKNVNFIPVSYVDEIIGKALFRENSKENNDWQVGTELLAQKPVATLRQ